MTSAPTRLTASTSAHSSSPMAGITTAGLAFIFAVRLTSGVAERNLDAPAADLLTLLADAGTVATLVAALIKRRAQHLGVSLAGALALIFLFFLAIGALNPLIFGSQLSVYGLRAMSLPLLTYFAARAANISQPQASFIWKVLWLLLMANFLAGVRQGLIGLSADEMNALAANGSTYLVDGSFRLPGWQMSGQDFSLLAGGTAAWALARVMSLGRRKAGYATIALGVTAAISTTIALQRGPVIALTSALAITVATLFFGPGGSGSRVLRSLMAGFLALVVFSAVAISINPGRASDVSDQIESFTQLDADHSYRVRLSHTVPTSMHLIAEQPWSGYGTGASGPAASALAGQSPLLYYPLGGVVADNGYFLIALQIGIPGALIFAGMLVGWAWRGSLIKPASDVAGTRSLISFLMIAMLVGGYWGLTGPMCALFGLLGLTERRWPRTQS